MLEANDLIALKKRGVQIGGLMEAAARHVRDSSAYTKPPRNPHGKTNIEQQWRDLNRTAEIMALADVVMCGDVQAAIYWLQCPIEKLSNQSPLELAMTESGSQDLQRFMEGMT